MVHARNISIAMTLVGLALTIAGMIASLDALVTVTGMLLFVAGIVKIGMVAIWKSFFTIPVDTPAPSEAPRNRQVRKGKV